MAKKFEKVPSSAFTLNGGEDSIIKFKEDSESFEMVAYSGKVVNHWWFGELIINLAGMEFPKSKYPILQDHDTSLKIGFVSKPKKIENELRFTDKEFTFVDTEESIRFREEAKQGFPFEASVGIRPTKIIRLEEGGKAEVNGNKVKGPIAIWDQSIFRETSVVVFGTDPNTSSKVFSEEEQEEVEVEVVEFKEGTQNLEQAASGHEELNEGGDTMDLAELKAKYPELVTEIQTGLQAEIEAKFKAENDSLKTEKATLSGKLDDVTATLSAQADKIDALQKENEKREVLRQEQELKAQANEIWDAHLAECDVPAHLHAKVKQMVGHGKFTENGALNVETFTAAITAEIATWIVKEGDTVVAGFSHRKTTTSTVTTDAAYEKEMLELAGDNEALAKMK